MKFVTPEQFGAKKLYDTTYLGRDADSTKAVQEAADSPYPVFIDGCYFTPGIVNIKQPKLFQMMGSPDLVNPVNPKQAIGCLYSGIEAGDMFHVFSEGFELRGGLLDFRNCIYSNGGPIPSGIKYFYFYNLIQSGSIDTTIMGRRSEVERYGAGHLGLSIDCSRTTPEDPKGRPGGFAEMHYLDIRLKGLWLNTLIHTSLDEPFQQYSDQSLNHTTAAGRSVVSRQDGLLHIADVDNYTIPANSRRYFTISSERHKYITFRAQYQSGKSWAETINECLIEQGFSNRDFQAIPIGINQSFRIQSPHPFTLKTYRPCLATIANIEFHSIGCKQALYLDTLDNATIKGTIQTHPNLVRAPWDSSINEFDKPGATILGNGNTFDLHTVDLNKGSIPGVRQANKVAWINYGEKNKPVGRSLESLEMNQAFSKTELDLSDRVAYHNNWGLKSNQSGFISDLDNCLYFAHRTYEVTTKGAEVKGLNNLFQNGPAVSTIIYPTDFDEALGTVEIEIKPNGKLDIGALFVQLASSNCPRIVSVTVTGTSGTKTIEESLMGGFKRQLHFQTFNQNNNSQILIKLIGVKNKRNPVTLQQIAARNKTTTPEMMPVLSKAGGKVYGPVYADAVHVLGSDGQYKQLKAE